jgi:type I restriction enzyme R subunit
MSPHAYTEDQLVEQPAIGLFAALGWHTVSAMEETFGAGGTLGRETKGEVVLTDRLRAAFTRLNPGLPAEAIQTAIDELARDRSAMSLEAANREIYRLLKDGIPVSVPDREHGGQKTERLRVVDWAQPEQNDFLLVSQLSVVGSLYTCRPDLVAFVNGLPWVVIELKKPGVPARSAFDENLTHYKQQIPQLFWYSTLLIASNGTDSCVGSLTADWERFFEWKRIKREDEPRRVSLEVMLRGTCDRTRLLDLVENFTLFSEHKAGLVKILGQNHQFLGVNNAVRKMLEARKLGHGRGGVFWQTQGSGKSFSMSNSLDDEQERHVREHLTEEELVIFDILTRPAPELTTAERDEVKKVAKVLLERLNTLLVLNWRQKSAARSTLKLAIEDTLDTLPAAYDRPLFVQKCSALFEHVYESYPERNAGVYAEAV